MGGPCDIPGTCALTAALTGGAAWVFALSPTAHDFNGDFKSDILFRDSNGGGVVLWLMNGATISSALGVGNVPTDWQIQGVNAD